MTKNRKLTLSAAALAAMSDDNAPVQRGGVSGYDLTQTIAGLRSDFDRVQAQLTETLNRQDAEIQRQGASSTATARQVEDFTAQLSRIGQDMQHVQAAVRELENASARPPVGGGQRRSVGARFVEDESYTAFRNTSRTMSEPVRVGSFLNIDSSSGSAGAAIEPHRMDGIISSPEREYDLTQLLNVVPLTDSNSVQYVEEAGFTNNAAPRAEGAAAAQSSLTYALRTAQAENISHFMPATRQLINDAPRLRAQIDSRGIYGLRLARESQVLYGNGTTPNIQGITTHASVQVHDWSDGVVGDTQLDCIRRAITKARLAEYPVTGIVMNPTDWQNVELLKDSDKRYIWVQVTVGGETRLWRVPVIDTTAVVAGTYVLGAWGLAAQLHEREEAQVRITESHSDWFIRGQLALLFEERMALTIERPQGFVKGSFDSAPV